MPVASFWKGWTHTMRFRSALRLTATLGTATLLPLAASGAAVAAHSPGGVAVGTRSVLTAAQAERLAAHATHRSIIIFKNQLTGLPAKGATAKALHGRLTGPDPGPHRGRPPGPPRCRCPGPAGPGARAALPGESAAWLNV
jgi:hypothetical protein